jgi:hypothetical protein
VATVFLIPGYVPDAARTNFNLDDVWAGTTTADRLAPADPGLMTWAEIEAISRSEAIDFQSHTLFHHRVPIADRIVGFVSPDTADILFDLPVPRGFEDDVMSGGRDAVLGAPIFESDSFMADTRVFKPDPDFVRACLETVRQEGGRKFFADRGWRRRLEGLAAEWRSKHGGLGHQGDRTEHRGEIAEDLVRSREMIEARLPGQRVRHLCYPYSIGSELAVDASRGAGFASNYWGVLPGRRGNRPGDDPFHCVRLKSDFIFRLPGRGRKSFARIAFDKAKRRLSGRPVY